MRTPWLTLIVGAVVVSTAALTGFAPDALVWDRGSLLAEPWRLVTGHLVHADAGHLVWNVAAWAVLGATTERLIGPRRMALALAAGIIAVDLSLLALPAVTRFCGLSSLLNTLYAVACLTLWRRNGGALPLLLLAAGAAKIGTEIILGAPVLTTPTWPPIAETHAAGLLVGLLWPWATGPQKQIYI